MKQSGEVNNISFGRLGERVLIKTPTATGEGIRRVLTKPFRAVIPKSLSKSSDGNQNESNDSNCASGNSSLLARSFSYSNCNESEARSDPRIDHGSRNFARAECIVRCHPDTGRGTRTTFAGKFRQRKMSEQSLRSLPESSSLHVNEATPLLNKSICKEITAFLASDSVQNDLSGAVAKRVQHAHIHSDQLNAAKPSAIIRSSSSSACTAAQSCEPGKRSLEEVHIRRRDTSTDRNASARPSQNSAPSQVLNRSYPCVFDSSQFAAIRSPSYVERLPDPDESPSSRLRTAVVGPHTVHRGSNEGYCSNAAAGEISRSLYENGSGAVFRSASPLGRHDNGDMSSYTSRHRRSVQSINAVGLYQLCENTQPLHESQRHSDVGMLISRASRPRDIRLPTASPAAHGGDSSPTKQTASVGGRRTINSGVNAQLSGMQVDEGPEITAASNSRKVMVAPQPHYRSHHKERVEGSCRVMSDQHCGVQRRLSVGALPGCSTPLQNESHHRRGYIRESPVGTSSPGEQFSYDEQSSRPKHRGENIRVAVLEQRVRELEAAVIAGQTPSTSAAASFIIPVLSTKGQRMLQSAPGQIIVSPTTQPSTQQLMAQEIVDKEVEIERLQSQLRKCYSRMELRQVQYDEEVNSFRRESEEAKSQLAKVKSRLSELENECGVYREKASAVEAARSAAAASSLEKIATQEKEIAALRNELEKSSALLEELEKSKQELEFLELQNETLNNKLDAKDAMIKDLEDSVFALKMEASCKLYSGSTTPRGDECSLFDLSLPKCMGDLKDLKELTPTPGKTGVSLSDIPLGVKRSSSSHHFSSPGPTGSKLQLSPNVSHLIRKLVASTLECRLQAKCLKDIASKAACGDAPSVNRLLGCRSDSMSESEAEPLPVDSNPMSISSAERYLRKGTEDLNRVEQDLNDLREKFVEYYQKKVAEELKDDESCKIQ